MISSRVFMLLLAVVGERIGSCSGYIVHDGVKRFSTTTGRRAKHRLHLVPPELATAAAATAFDSQFILDTASTVLSDAVHSQEISYSLSIHASSAFTTMTNLAVAGADGLYNAQPPETAGISYSRASYYTILGLYAISFPGLWSTIKRSTKAKIKRKTYVSAGENAPANENGKSLRQEAGEIMAYMKANNYDVAEAGETITFRGIVPRSLSQAFFLSFCTLLGMLSLALVLQIQFQNVEFPSIGGVQPNWFWLAFVSPYAGLYYWRSGDRVDDCSVKLSTNDDETENEIVVQGSEEELERMWRALGWREKGMVKIQGLLE